MSKRKILQIFALTLLITGISSKVNAQGQNAAISRVLSGAGRQHSNLRSTARPVYINQNEAEAAAATRSRFCLKTALTAVSSFRRETPGNLHFEALTANEAGRVRRDLALLIDRGQVPSHNRLQGKLYADFLYIKKLSDEGRYGDVLTVAAEARRRSGWTNEYLNDNTFDLAETGTYFRTSTLQKLIRLAEYEAKVRQSSTAGSSASREILHMFVEYLDHKRAFDTTEHLLGGGGGRYFSMSPFIDHITALAYSFKDQEGWERRSTLDRYPEIAGIAITQDSIDIYFGASQIYMVRVDLASRRGKLYDEREAGQLFKQFCKNQINANSTEAMHLVNIVPIGGAYRLSFSDVDITLTAAELQQLRSGRRLDSTHPFSRKIQTARGSIVVWSNPFMEKSNTVLEQAESFIHVAERAYPRSAIFRDDFRGEQTESKATALRSFQVTGPGDIVAVIDRNSLVQDGNIINNISDDLSRAHIKVINYTPGLKWNEGEGKGLIVITGHIDRALAQFIRQLGEAGYFKGNYVLLNSCHTKLSTQMVNEINERYGAVATLRHKDMIRPVDVENFLISFAETINQQGDFWWKVVKSLNRHNLSAAWVICRNNIGISIDKKRHG